MKQALMQSSLMTAQKANDDRTAFTQQLQATRIQRARNAIMEQRVSSAGNAQTAFDIAHRGGRVAPHDFDGMSAADAMNTMSGLYDASRSVYMDDTMLADKAKVLAEHQAWATAHPNQLPYRPHAWDTLQEADIGKDTPRRDAEPTALGAAPISKFGTRTQTGLFHERLPKGGESDVALVGQDGSPIQDAYGHYANAVEKYGRPSVYAAMARQAGSAEDFAGQLAGQLAAERERATGVADTGLDPTVIAALKKRALVY